MAAVRRLATDHFLRDPLERQADAGLHPLASHAEHDEHPSRGHQEVHRFHHLQHRFRPAAVEVVDQHQHVARLQRLGDLAELDGEALAEAGLHAEVAHRGAVRQRRHQRPGIDTEGAQAQQRGHQRRQHPGGQPDGAQMGEQVALRRRALRIADQQAAEVADQGEPAVQGADRIGQQQPDGEGHYQRQQPVAPAANPQQAQAIDDALVVQPAGNRLVADGAEHRGEQRLLLLVMPGVEPHAAHAEAPQVFLEQAHQRTLAAAPVAGDGDGQRRLGALIAQERRQAPGARGEVQTVLRDRGERPVGGEGVGDGLVDPRLRRRRRTHGGGAEGNEAEQPGQPHPGRRIAGVAGAVRRPAAAAIAAQVALVGETEGCRAAVRSAGDFA
ncbi:hypothetical protein D3C78_506380 [compost metagenome]